MPARRTGPLTSVTLVAAALAMLVGVGAVLVLGRMAAADDQAAYVERLHKSTERVFKAAIDPRYQSKADELDRVLNRLLVIDAIAGGALFDGTGHLQETVGEAPYTAFETVRQARTAVFHPPDRRRAEFYYPPEATGTPFHLLVRIDLEAASELEAESWARRLSIALGTGLLVGFAAAASTSVLVSRPLVRIAAALDAMVADPGAEGGPALPAGRTEIGRLAAALDRFRGTLSDVWRTKVAVADAILDRAPFAVVQMTADGSVSFANAAAADLFEREITRGHGVALTVRDPASGAEAGLREHLARVRGGCRLVEIVGTRVPRHAVVGSLTIGTEGRAPVTVAMFADVSDAQAARIEAESRFASGAALLRTARRREAELKLMLESCLTLLAGPDRRADEHLDPLPFAAEWLAGAKEAGLAIDTLVLNAEGPSVEAPSEDLRAVMRLALLVAYARSGAAPADMAVEAKGINFETAGVTVRAQRSAQAAGATEAVTADWQLAFAALRTAIRRANGQLTEFTATEDGTVLRFVLRGAAERVQAVKAR